MSTSRVTKILLDERFQSTTLYIFFNILRAELRPPNTQIVIDFVTVYVCFIETVSFFFLNATR